MAQAGPKGRSAWVDGSCLSRPFCPTCSAASMAISPSTVAEIDDAATAAVATAAVGDGGGWSRHVICRISGWVGLLSLDIGWWCGIRWSGGFVVSRSAISGPRCPITRWSVRRTRRHITRCSVCGSRCPITRCPITRCEVCGTRCYIRRLTSPRTRRHINPSIRDIDTSGRHVDGLQFPCRNLRRR
jgi:hypothetical protein